MKKLILSYLLVLILFVSNSFAQEAGEPKKKGWPSAERYGFITSCIREAKSNMSEDSARFYCYCMLDRVEKKYPTIEEASKITETDMQSAAWQKDIKECLGGYWGSAEREAFLSNCISSAQKGGIGEEKSKSYCGCMLYKVEIRYPNPLDAEKLTPEVLDTPDWKKILKGCLDF
jgi:hypothetical protein